MVDYTRRTHIVRVPMDAKPPAPGKKPAKYIDIEVLDAIAFRIDNGHEVIIDMATANSRPMIIDKTGGGHGKRASDPTQLTHMKRVKSGDQAIDIEVPDVLSCRDQNGQEWILDMQLGEDFYDVTDHTGDARATRRVHDEKVYSGKKPAPGTDASKNKHYLTCQRDDNVAFRALNGKEVIFVCTSYDDGKGDRAATYIWSPQNYKADDDKGPKPPLLADSKDQHNYVAPVKDAKGFFTAAEKLNMGPFWWIRKVKGLSGIAVLIFHYEYRHNFPAEIGFPQMLITGEDQSRIISDVSSEFPADGVDLSGKFVMLTADGKEVPIVDPVSDEMFENLVAWEDKPFHEVLGGDTHLFKGTAVVFFNLSEMENGWPIRIVLPAMPAGAITIPGATTYYVWFNSGDPFPGPFASPSMDISYKSFIGGWKLTPDGNGLIFTGNPFDIVYASSWAGNLALAEAVLATPGLAGGWHLESQTAPPIVIADHSRYDWSATLLTYDQRMDFPLDPVNQTPLWPAAEGLIDEKDLSGTLTNGESGITISFSVDDQLKVTGNTF